MTEARFNIFSMRWLLLPVVAFWLFQTGRNVGHPLEMFAILVIPLVSLTLLLTQMGRPISTTLWIWTILFTFVLGYFYKSYWVSEHLLEPSRLIYAGSLRWVTEEIIARGLRNTTPAFVTFCITGWAILSLGSRRAGLSTGAQMTDDAALRRYRRMLAFAVALAIVSICTAILQARLGIGIMGINSERLPYQLDTVLFRARRSFLPGFMLLLIWVTDRPRFRNLWIASVLLLFLHWMVSGVLTTSRGAIVEFLVPVVFLWILTGRFHNSRKGILVASLLLGAILYPILSQLRIERMTHSEGVIVALKKTVGRWNVQSGSKSIVEGLSMMVLRVTGSDSVWYAQEAMPTENSVARVRSLLVNLPQYFTRDVAGVKMAGEFRSPGMLGAFLVLGGPVGAVVFMALYLLGAAKVWAWLSTFETAPVAQSTFGFYLLILSSGGQFYFPEMVMLAATIWSCEAVYKHGLGSRRHGARAVAPRAPAPAMATLLPAGRTQ